MTTIQIVSSNINVPVDSFRLDYVFQITLNSSVSFNVFVLSNNNVVYTRQMTLSGDDYKNWGNDDTYLINYVANQLGFTVKPVVPNPTLATPRELTPPPAPPIPRIISEVKDDVTPTP